MVLGQWSRGCRQILVDFFGVSRTLQEGLGALSLSSGWLKEAPGNSILGD